MEEWEVFQEHQWAIGLQPLHSRMAAILLFELRMLLRFLTSYCRESQRSFEERMCGRFEYLDNTLGEVQAGVLEGLKYLREVTKRYAHSNVTLCLPLALKALPRCPKSCHQIRLEPEFGSGTLKEKGSESLSSVASAIDLGNLG